MTIPGNRPPPALLLELIGAGVPHIVLAAVLAGPRGGTAHGNLTWAAWAPDSLRIVVGDTGGGVETFTCTICARTQALVAQAKARLAGLG